MNAKKKGNWMPFWITFAILMIIQVAAYGCITLASTVIYALLGLIVQGIAKIMRQEKNAPTKDHGALLFSSNQEIILYSQKNFHH